MTEPTAENFDIASLFSRLDALENTVSAQQEALNKIEAELASLSDLPPAEIDEATAAHIKKVLAKYFRNDAPAASANAPAGTK